MKSWFVLFGMKSSFNSSYNMPSKCLYFENVHESYVFELVSQKEDEKNGLKLIERYKDEMFLFKEEKEEIFSEISIIHLYVNEAIDREIVLDFIKNNIKHFNKEYLNYINLYFKFKNENFYEFFI